MRVVVLGAGYAGVVLTRALESRLPRDVELVLVNETPTHLVQHELHRLVRHPERRDTIEVPLTDVLSRADVRVARVTDVDVDRRTVVLADGSTIDYDVGALCLGAQTAFFDVEGSREHATPLKRVEHALEIRERIGEVLADRTGEGGGDGVDRPSDPGRVVVVGAGLSGVQVAGELAQLVRDRDAPVAVTLLEQFDAVAPSFPKRFQTAIESALLDLDVEVRTGTTVTGVSADRVAIADGSEIEYDQLVWTGGIRGVDAVDGDRPTVHSDLRLNHRTFVLGDAARVIDADGTAVPASAQAAVGQARVAATNVTRLVEHERGDEALFDPRMDHYRFESPGWLVSVGDASVAQVGPAVLTGRVATALKAGVGVGYLSSVGAVGNAIDRATDELGHVRRSW